MTLTTLCPTSSSKGCDVMPCDFSKGCDAKPSTVSSSIPQPKTSREGVLSIELVLARSRAKTLPGVKKLNVWHNKIRDISIVESLPNLTVLNLSSNHVANLRPLRHCSLLVELYLRRNKIASITELGFLRDCAALRSAWFAGNPLGQEFSTIQEYRLAVIQQLPQLTFLDNILISNEERDLAKSASEVCLQRNNDNDNNDNDNNNDDNDDENDDEDEKEMDDHSQPLHGNHPLRDSPPSVRGFVTEEDDEDEKEESDEKEDDDDDVDNDNVEQEEKSVSGRGSDADLLASSLRFFVAESNSIREKLGLNPIRFENLSLEDADDDDDDDEATMDDADSGAIDDDDVDYDDDDLDILNSYADVLDGNDGDDDDDEREDDFDDDDEVGEVSMNDPSISGDHLSISGNQPSISGDYRSTSGSTETRSSLLSATLLLLQNLSAEELREVERESVHLRMTKRNVETIRDS